MKRLIGLAVSHMLVGAAGFALGIYLLPILTAPESPDRATLEEQARGAQFSAEFVRDLRGSDFLHWGEGTVSLSADRIVHQGRLAPGPDYRLYLVDGDVAHEDDFAPLKASARQVGAIRTFDGFIVDLPDGVDLSRYTTVLVWCEAFGEFITSARYR